MKEKLDLTTYEMGTISRNKISHKISTIQHMVYIRQCAKLEMIKGSYNERIGKWPI